MKKPKETPLRKAKLVLAFLHLVLPGEVVGPDGTSWRHYRRSQRRARERMREVIGTLEGMMAILEKADVG